MYYVRDNGALIKPQTFSNIVDAQHLPYVDHNTNFYQPFGPGQDLLSNNMDNQLLEIPQLDSPTAISTSLAATGMKSNTTMDEDLSNESRSQFIDWKNLDSLIGLSQISTPDSFSFPHSNLLPHCYEPEAQENVGNSSLGGFPNL